MRNTAYYNLNIVDGTDIVNPLTVDNPNYEIIDEVMHDNAVSGVTLATEIANANVHALTRENSECAVIRFIATSNWKKGDTITVDGLQVTALLPNGETLPDAAYVINANVLCILTGTNLTVFAGSNLDAINNRIRDLYLLSSEPIADANYSEIGVLQHIAPTTANWASNNAYLITYGGSTGQRFQYAVGINDLFVRMRVYNGVTWTDWVEIVKGNSNSSKILRGYGSTDQITFPTGFFTQGPSVVVNCTALSEEWMYLFTPYSITTNGFSVSRRAFNVNSGVVAATEGFEWIAIGI